MKYTLELSDAYEGNKYYVVYAINVDDAIQTAIKETGLEVVDVASEEES